MRGMLLLTALLCVLVAECAGQGLKADLLDGAHRCCVSQSQCSVAEKNLLAQQKEAYEFGGHGDAHDVSRYVDLAVAGGACGRNVKRGVNDNYAMYSGPQGPFDVAQDEVKFNATFTLYIAGGIYYSYISASISLNGTYRTVYPSDYYYYNANASVALITKTVTFVLPRYSMYGLWTVSAYGYGPNYYNYTATTGNFTVVKNLNDVQSPKLVSLNTSVWNLNDTSDRSIAFTASDDVSGVYALTAYITNINGSTIGYGNFYIPADANGKVVGSVLLTSSVLVYPYYDLAVGVYNLSVYVTDVVGTQTFYGTEQLKALGIQSTITVAQGLCRAGRKLAYGASGSCTLCDKGTFSGDGAFRCKACLPGTASNVAGARSCVTCPPGTASIGGSAGCDVCPAGTESSSSGNYECRPCRPGFNSTEGSEFCTSCPYGYFSTGGAVTCTPCPVGTYSNDYAASYCNQCAPGTYQPFTGQTTCLTAPANCFTWVGASTLQPCPSPTTQGPPGSNSRLNCY